MVEHYEHCVSRLRDREVELDAKTSQSVPFTCNVASLVTKNAASILTLAVFKKVKIEIVNLVSGR